MKVLYEDKINERGMIEQIMSLVFSNKLVKAYEDKMVEVFYESSNLSFDNFGRALFIRKELCDGKVMFGFKYLDGVNVIPLTLGVPYYLVIDEGYKLIDIKDDSTVVENSRIVFDMNTLLFSYTVNYAFDFRANQEKPMESNDLLSLNNTSELSRMVFYILGVIEKTVNTFLINGKISTITPMTEIAMSNKKNRSTILDACTRRMFIDAKTFKQLIADYIKKNDSSLKNHIIDNTPKKSDVAFINDFFSKIDTKLEKFKEEAPNKAEWVN